MTLFYRMMYVFTWGALARQNAGAEMIQEVVDSADCLLWTSPPIGGSHKVEFANPLYIYNPQGYKETIFSSGMIYDNVEKIFKPGDIEVYYKHIDIKMCDVKDRQEAFAEINHFMSVNNIETNSTYTRLENEELIIFLYKDMWGVELQESGYVCVPFVLSDKRDKGATFPRNEDKDNPPPLDLFRFNGVYYPEIQPSKPDKYMQRYLDSRSASVGQSEGGASQ